MSVKLKLIAAACENMGIGKNGKLPWNLRVSLPSTLNRVKVEGKEMTFFKEMTSNTKDNSKKNVVIMGRRTWESIPTQHRPLPNRINFILTSSDLNIQNSKDVYIFKSLDDAINALENNPDFKGKFESVWVIGGSSVYRASMESKNFYKLYLTKVLKEFDCDTFLPPLPEDLKEISEPEVPQDIQEENGIEFVYKILVKTEK